MSDEWMPIETCPNDTFVLVYMPWNGLVRQAKFNTKDTTRGRGWRVALTSRAADTIFIAPTRWRPMPRMSDKIWDEAIAEGKRDAETMDLQRVRLEAKAYEELTDKAIARLEKRLIELDEAINEAHTCDDINLDQPLAGIIADLEKDRTTLNRQLSDEVEWFNLALEYLRSIAANKCCASCQEAALVAQECLDKLFQAALSADEQKAKTMGENW